METPHVFVRHSTFPELYISMYDSSQTKSQTEIPSKTQREALCDRCQLLQLREPDFSRGSARETEGCEIGSYADIASRDCALCQLIVHIVQMNETSREKVNANQSLECSLIWTASNLYEYHTLLPTFDYYSQYPPPALAVCLSDAPLKSTPKFVGLFVQNPVIEHFGDFIAFMDFKARRYDATKSDTSLAKIWLHCCEEWHGVYLPICINVTRGSSSSDWQVPPHRHCFTTAGTPRRSG